MRASEKNEEYIWAKSVGTSDPVEVSRASSRMRGALNRLNGLGARVRVHLSEDVQFLIDTTGSTAVLLSDVNGPVDLDISVSPAHVNALLDHELEPRTAIQFGYLRLVGDPVLAIRFGDMLSETKDWAPRVKPASIPRPTLDLEEARRDLVQSGYCLIQDALSADAVSALRDRLVEQNEAELAFGSAMRDGGPKMPNVRLWSLINKGREFEELLSNSLIPTMTIPYLGEGFVLGSYTSNTAGPGSEPQVLHYDQQVLQPSPSFQIGINFAWFLDDVTDDNGGTRVIPGSHLWTRGPDNPYSIESTIAATGPKGTVMLWDTRLWHGTGPNRTKSPRHVILSIFYRYYIRTNQNFTLSVSPEVEQRLSDDVKTMLGFRITGRLGSTEELVEGKIVSRSANPIGRLTLSQVRASVSSQAAQEPDGVAKRQAAP